MGESGVERQRRSWVERQEQWKDVEETYNRESASASPEERRRLMARFAEQRKAHREEDVELGKRAPGFGIQMQQVMWARWIEVAIEHELVARTAYADILAKPSSDPLLREFHASLVAITGAAYSIEALFREFKYLVPAQPRRDKRHLTLSRAFGNVFGLPDDRSEVLARDLDWLFALRDDAVHPYTESMPPATHPTGINTGAEHSRFNAVTSGEAIDVALALLDDAASPPAALNTWVQRRSIERSAHFDVLAMRRDGRDSQPLKT